jgi:diguanylate cyclase (GGDEF)-like protein/putative nucleotidyltransferase with HDIG domain
MSAQAEWRPLAALAGSAPALILPVLAGTDLIGVVLVGDPEDGEPFQGPDREALAFLIGHLAPELDYARVRADLTARIETAAALSAARARLTAALGTWEELLAVIVESLAGQPGIQDVALVLRQEGSARTLQIVAAHGDVSAVVPEIPLQPRVSQATVPTAWLPLRAGAGPAGALFLRWRMHHVVTEQEQQLLTVYAASVATALEHARLYRQTRYLAEHDPVTDLYNYRSFHSSLEDALARGRRADRPVGLLLIDLSNFKLFNDTYGHQAGDGALRHVADLLRRAAPPPAAVARLGGDEFGVVLPDLDRAGAVAAAAQVTLLAAQAAIAVPDGLMVPIHVTIGVAAFPQDAGAINTLLARADERLYEAKRTGGVVASDQGAEQETTGQGIHFGLLESLVAMVDNRDRYTAAHSEQVAGYACALAAGLGLSHRTIETLRTAGLLHDVGKIGVPDRVLRKPGRLTLEETAIMRRHVELSEALVRVTSRDHDLIDAVAHHHERWDGGGYPRRIGGEAVPLVGRIMIVADAVSAMAMDRPYRKGLRWDVIAGELERGAGTQFDPAIVPLALRVLQPLIEEALAAPA